MHFERPLSTDEMIYLLDFKRGIENVHLHQNTYRSKSSLSGTLVLLPSIYFHRGTFKHDFGHAFTFKFSRS